MNKYRIERIQHLKLCGKNVTIVNVFELCNGHYLFIGQKCIKGTFKRTNTILKKLGLQNDHCK